MWIAVAAVASTLLGPASPAPFSTITLELTGLANTNRETFHEFWDPSLGAEFAAVTPLPRGFLEIAFHPFASRPEREDLPEIRSLVTSLGWGGSVDLPARFTARASARTAVVWMLYDPAPRRAAQDENELAFGARASVERGITRRWSAQAGIRVVRVLTREPIDWVFAGAGLSISFETPSWLREFLE